MLSFGFCGSARLSALTAFRVLRTPGSSNIISEMTDPFRTVALRSRVVKIATLALLATFVSAIAYFQFGSLVTEGHDVRAQVLNVGTYPVADVAGGNLPIVTVRLPDGSIRNVRATWADVNGCISGRWISLVQQGSALQVGQPGCSTAS